MQKTALSLIFLSTLLAIIRVDSALAAGAEKRWYSAHQITQGKRLYTEHCAKCHGENAEATPDWRKSDTNGLYPPPPLNGTAHAWHHPLPQLRLSIRHGGARFGGKMPPFDDTLSATEIDSIIAWFQSLWPDETYHRWATGGASQISKPTQLP